MRAKKAGIITKIVILGIALYAVVTLISLQGQLKEAQASQTLMEKEIEEATHENAAMEYSIKHIEDPETIEDIARDRLGLVMPGEKIFYDINK